MLMPKVKGAGGEENILAGGAKGELEVQWFWRGGEGTSQNLEYPAEFLKVSSFLSKLFW